MKMPTAHRRRSRSAGFTLVEVMVATAVASVVAAITLGIMSEGAALIRSAASNMLAHNTGSAAIRRITLGLQQANLARIYPAYQSATAGQFGSCLVVTAPDGTSAAYYLAPNPQDATTMALFYDSNAATAPNPATDKLLVTAVQDLEFRRDALGSVRAGFKIAVYGYPTKAAGSKEADVVRFTTSVLQRN